MIKAIVFDFDGTIIDTETAWYNAFKNAYKEYNVDLTLEQYSQCIGTSLHSFNPYEYLMTELNLPIDKDEFRIRIQGDHSELMNIEQVRPGVMDYLKLAKEAGLKIGLATSSHRAWADKYLDQLGIRDYFEVIQTSDDVEKVKPDPALYVQAMDALGVKPEETLAIEDSPNGAKAAAAAGMNVIVVPNALTKFLEFERYDKAHHAESLMDVDFQRAIAWTL
ncbi:HAD family hydrolase [Paenibacillus sp. HB172176]|uniref:HAD family hydrolase n=1 Tax=Paenibacillus sp. HB172176 TaxID=2493690 RepID=UPI00143C1480|nr:HAD family hydrolase [Paenibacillus sp. HB172176]